MSSPEAEALQERRALVQELDYAEGKIAIAESGGGAAQSLAFWLTHAAWIRTRLAELEGGE